MSNLFDIPTVQPTADAELAARLQQRIDRKTKPLGALGQLERLALQLGLVQRSEAPVLQSPRLLVFAADHGLARRGVSAYPQDVTWQMVENMLAGGAAVSVFARRAGLPVTVVDAGVAHDFAPRPGLLLRKVAPGTADASQGPAMTAEQCQAALAAGADAVRSLPGNAVLLGEMGIGNTSSAAMLLARLADVPLEAAVGRGTGLDAAGVARKRALLAEALARHAALRQPLALLAALGGFEIAGLVGAMLQAAHERRLIVVDGFIVGAAALVACAVVPAVRDYCVFAHVGAEAGHAALLRALQAQPLLALDMRLGEGSAAALAWPLVEAAALMLTQMASFESAGVSDSGR